MPNNTVVVHSLYAEAVLPDMTPVNPPMTFDGATVSEIPVPSGKLVITDAFFGFGFVYWSIEVNFGSGFVTLATFGFTLLAPSSTEIKRFKSPITIKGGAGVAMRLRVVAAAAPTIPIPVDATLRCFSESW